MDKLRFGADVPISHTLVELKPSTFEAGKKGTLFEWYGLEHCNDETNGGEVSLSFAFDSLPEPVKPEPIVLSKPWYLTAEGLYQIGVKETWERLGKNDWALTSKTNEIIHSLIERKGGTTSSVDGYIARKLCSFDRVVDEFIPTAAELVPFTNLKVKVEPPTIAAKKVDENPETSQPSPEVEGSKGVGGAKKKTVAQRVTGYPSLLGASVSRRVTTPRKYVEREQTAA